MTSLSKARKVSPYLFPVLFVGCFLLWLAFVGTLRRDELIVGVVAVALSAAFLTFVQGCEELKLKFSARDLLQCLRLPGDIAIGLAKVLVVLAKDLIGIRAESLFLVRRYSAGQDPGASGRPVLAVLYTSMSPNIIVLSIDATQHRMLYHQFDNSDLSRMTKNLGAAE